MEGLISVRAYKWWGFHMRGPINGEAYIWGGGGINGGACI